MPQQMVRCFWLSVWVTGIVLGGWARLPKAALAQIVPDATLGNERSLLVPNVASDRGLIDRIDGGALRGSNLFHSFSDFNVNAGQRVYFANPASISNIIGRITGSSLSQVDGTLGVLGGANLFLINPNGITFGPNAQLDIRGSFVASTANRVLFPNGYAFDVNQPDAPPLLTVNAPLGLASWLPTTGTLTNQGNLATGQDLALTGANLDLQGQLRGGRDVSLIATQALTARDRVTAPLIASAGQQLWVQGNQSVDIAALHRPESGLWAGGDLVVRSNGLVVADTRFTAGGNLRVERLDSSLGRVVSFQDPVFETGGDFSIADYTGASVQILAGGSVTIPGAITITGAGGPFNDSTVRLSNGSSLTVTGTTQPTVDIRAGTTRFFGSPAAGTPTSANITIGNIINPGGLVFLTNQFQPNPALAGKIAVGAITTATDPATGANGGNVAIDARGPLTFNTLDASGGDYLSFTVGGNGGDITLLAQGPIAMPFPASVYSYGLLGGNITLASGTAILQENGPLGINSFALSTIESATFGPGVGGAIRLAAPTIAMGGNIFSTTNGPGRSGDLTLTTDALATNQASILNWTFGSGDSGRVTVAAKSLAIDLFSILGTVSNSLSGGRGGDVTVQADTITATNGGQIASLAFGVGDVGNVTVKAQKITLAGFVPGDLTGGTFVPSAIFSSSQAGAAGNSGAIAITTGTLAISQGARVSTSVYGVGQAGAIQINASEAIQVDGAVFPDLAVDRAVQPSAIASELFTGAVGGGGDITIATPVLQVTKGGVITAGTFGQGDAGSIQITATQSATFDGVASFAAVGQPDRISRATVRAGATATGNAGTLTITTPTLTLTNGGQLTAETNGSGNAGNLQAKVSDSLVLTGAGSGILANTSVGATGNGGSIFVSNPDRATIREGAQIAVNSQGSGSAGNIFLQAKNLVLSNQGLITAETTSNTGGDIVLQVGDVLALLQTSRISTSAGTAGAGGDGGNIMINTRFLVAQPTGNSDITANAFTGRGGNVNITADGIFGFTVLSRAQLEAAVGTRDPNLLDPARLSTSDITAISRTNPTLNGTVVIQSPNADPVRGELPGDPQVVDASRLIAQDCAAGGAIGQVRGSFVMTGRGGVPSSPTDALGGNIPLVGWESGGVKPQAAVPAHLNPPTNPPAVLAPIALVEVQSFVKRSDGKVVLVASSGAPQFWQTSVNCRNQSPAGVR